MARLRFASLALALLLGLLVPPAASAGFMTGGNLTFTGEDGERNDVRVSLQSRSGSTAQLLVEDRGARIKTVNPNPANSDDPSGCVHVPGTGEKRVVCTVELPLRVNLHLGDMDDVGSTVGLPRDIRGELFGDAGSDNLTGGAADDTLDGGSESSPSNDAEVLAGGGGPDLLIAGGKASRLDGGTGNDELFSGPRNDRLSGGRGRDTASYANAESGSVTVDLPKRRSRGAMGRDRLRSIESAEGGQGNDVLIGTRGRNTLDGFFGNDLILGRGGADKLIGGRGKDIIDAGDRRRDRVDCGKGRDRVRADRRDRLTSCEQKFFR